jgi:hypothetical protein
VHWYSVVGACVCVYELSKLTGYVQEELCSYFYNRRSKLTQLYIHMSVSYVCVCTATSTLHCRLYSIALYCF